jgi:hypothetical protein
LNDKIIEITEAVQIGNHFEGNLDGEGLLDTLNQLNMLQGIPGQIRGREIEMNLIDREFKNFRYCLHEFLLHGRTSLRKWYPANAGSVCIIRVFDEANPVTGMVDGAGPSDHETQSSAGEQQRVSQKTFVVSVAVQGLDAG